MPLLSVPAVDISYDLDWIAESLENALDVSYDAWTAFFIPFRSTEPILPGSWMEFINASEMSDELFLLARDDNGPCRDLGLLEPAGAPTVAPSANLRPAPAEADNFTRFGPLLLVPIFVLFRLIGAGRLLEDADGEDRFRGCCCCLIIASCALMTSGIASVAALAAARCDLCLVVPLGLLATSSSSSAAEEPNVCPFPFDFFDVVFVVFLAEDFLLPVAGPLPA
mmetsp:Transcript_18789/g.45385  ORF Transcript_18789/g.45385 Transcript_18789/m.45385 type:complete len:224 (+) Transcript_18789:1297-1968(+)